MKGRVRPYFVVSIVFLVGLVALVASLLIIFPQGTTKNNIDQSIVDYFYSHRNSVLDLIFYIVTMLGEAYAYILILLILYYVWDKKKAFKAMLIVFTSNIVNALVKYAFNIPRPDKSLWYEKLDETSPGFPSGHAQVNTTFWGSIVLLTKKQWVFYGGCIIAGLVSFSRILLRVHWFTDVLGGIGIALIIIAFFAFVLKPLDLYVQKLSVYLKLLLILLLYAVYIIPTVLLIKDNEVMIDELKFITLFTTVMLSYLVEGYWIDFNSKPRTWVTGIIRVIIGVLSFVGVYFGLKYLFKLIIDVSTWVPGTEITLDLIRYALLGPVLILFAPWLMKKLNL
ncbi:MAG: phosphatase PAP2 family protein [Candidatus Heimdallarchaeaceae archaeon]